MMVGRGGAAGQQQFRHRHGEFVTVQLNRQDDQEARHGGGNGFQGIGGYLQTCAVDVGHGGDFIHGRDQVFFGPHALLRQELAQVHHLAPVELPAHSSSR